MRYARVFHIIEGMNPSISVLMPVYRNKDSLRRAVLSLLNQDYEGKIDVVLMFDDAQDGTIDEALALEKEYPDNVTLVRKDTPFGLGGARKEGIPYLKGDLIYSLDADDEMLPGAMKKMVDALLDNDADMVNACFDEVVGPKHKTYFYKKKAIYDKYQALDALFMDASFRSFLWSKLYRRELLSSRPLSILEGKGVMFEDLSFVASLLLGAKKVVSIKDSVINYYQDVVTSSSASPRKDRTLRHLAAFAITRLTLERSGDPKALQMFLRHRFRTYLSIAFDLGKDKKSGADKAYVKNMKRAFRDLFKKGTLDVSKAPYQALLENAFIA